MSHRPPPPLGEFADRLARNPSELTTVLQYLVKEHRAGKSMIRDIAEASVCMSTEHAGRAASGIQHSAPGDIGAQMVLAAHETESNREFQVSRLLRAFDELCGRDAA